LGSLVAIQPVRVTGPWLQQALGALKNMHAKTCDVIATLFAGIMSSHMYDNDWPSALVTRIQDVALARLNLKVDTRRGGVDVAHLLFMCTMQCHMVDDADMRMQT